MEVRDLLSEKKLTDAKVIRENSTLRETAERLVLHQIGALVVINENRQPIGIISERDLIRAITQYGAGLVDEHVDGIMSRSIITCRGQDNILDVLSVMKSNAIRHLPVMDESELAGVVSIRDLTRACEMLQVQASTDSLTGLPNRRNFLDVSANELERSRRYEHTLSVVMIDIDRFKKVNDTYGHAAGDAVLQGLASIVKANLRSVDLFARLGGEEFAALLPETGRLGAMEAAEKLRTMIANSAIKSGDHKINVTASFGVTVFDNEDESVEVLINRADEALYQAKNAGRNRTVYLGSDANLSDVA